MAAILKYVYAPFLLVLAAILIFSGRDGRRLLVLALACGGAITFLFRFLYPQLQAHEAVAMQMLYFPFLVLGTWAILFLVSRFRR